MLDGELRLGCDNRPCLWRNGEAVTEEDGALLFGLAVSCRPQLIVEVGHGAGRSMHEFMEARAHIISLGLPCDVWSCDIDSDKIASGRLRWPEAHFVCGDSEQLANEIAGQPDFLFIDGEHTYQAVLRDVENLKRVARPGAVWLFHDTDPVEFAQVKAAMDDLGVMCLPAPRGMGIARW